MPAKRKIPTKTNVDVAADGETSAVKKAKKNPSLAHLASDRSEGPNGEWKKLLLYIDGVLHCVLCVEVAVPEKWMETETDARKAQVLHRANVLLVRPVSACDPVVDQRDMQQCQ